MFGATNSTGSIASTEQNQPRIRLEYLDGLRGLAALLVFLYHICREIDWRLKGGELPPLILSAGRFIPYGRIAVGIFIVLSGYCLMLPVVRSITGQLSGSWLDYFKRRARRILPPYYAALVLSLLLFLLVPAALSPTMGLHWNEAQPAFTPGVLLSHGLLLHNLKHDWLYKINGVMWSVATEWQIYFFFPFLLLLPIGKRFGLPLTVVTAFAVGLAPHYLLHRYLDGAVPWYLGLFALGMAGAAIGFSKQPSLIVWREKLPWGLLCLGLIAVFASKRSVWEDYHAWIVDALIGAVTACLLIYCTQCLTRAKNTQPLILQLLDSRWAVVLGTFSYSLYLVHAPLLGLTQLFVNSLLCLFRLWHSS
jgi:peptidoglycan/LPS O-acetylase OafA/YrhL